MEFPLGFLIPNKSIDEYTFLRMPHTSISGNEKRDILHATGIRYDGKRAGRVAMPDGTAYTVIHGTK